MRYATMTWTAVLFAGAACAANSTFTQVTANTPETAYQWSDPANWKDGIVPGVHDQATFNAGSAPYYVVAENGLLIRQLTGSKNLRLIADELVFSDGGGASRVQLEGDAYIYAAIQNGTESDHFDMPYACPINFCGPVKSYQHFVSAWGTSSQRLDLYATSADPVRTNDLWIAPGKRFFPGSGNVRIYAPVGADKVVGQWNQTEGSPYVHRATSTEYPIAPGALVTGEGIPEGTFIKRKFDAATLELSQPVTATAAGNTLTFGAITPEMRMRVEYFARQGSTATELWFGKKRAQDVAILEMDTYHVMNLQTNVTGISTADMKNGYLPGTFVLHKVTGDGRSTDRLLNCHLVFAGQPDTGDNTSFPLSRNVIVDAADATAELTVPEGKSGWINRFGGVNGTLLKDGKGTLTIGLTAANSPGTVTVAEGTLNIHNDSDADAARLGAMVLKAGATLVLEPGMTIAVDELNAEAGSKIVGGGKLIVLRQSVNGVIAAVEVAADTELVVKTGVPGAFVEGKVEAKVVGHPAFWLDASKPETIEYSIEGNANYVTRWNDCRPGEPMFCTNITARPQFVNGEKMDRKYVRLGNVNTTEYKDTEALVWSVPVGGIKAVFLVQDPCEGGGEILGASPRLTQNHSQYYGTQGGPYYRGGSLNRGSALISPNYSTPCVKAGRFFIDGKEVVGYSAGYPGSCLTLVEHHVNTNFAANASHPELWIDAFGAGYADKSKTGGDFIRSANGGMRISEYIIYTNSLTYAERVQTAMYLSRKWLGRDVFYNEVDMGGESTMGDIAASGAKVEVAAGEQAVAGNVTGAGDLTKTGEGALYLRNLGSGNLKVSEGEVRVWSLSLDNGQPPADAWLHVDADDAETVEITNGKVTKWNDASGNGVSLRPVAYPTTYPGTRLEGDFNGRASIDLGTCNGADKASYRYYKADGTAYEHDNSGVNSYITGAPSVKDAFFAFGSRKGGGQLFGSYGNGYPTQGFPHEHKLGTDTPLLWVSNYWNMAFVDNGFSNRVAQGSAVFRMNGQVIDPFTAKYSGGYDLLWYSDASGKVSDTFGTYGQGAGYVGGVELGEILLYTNKLSEAEARLVHAYLDKKWFNRDTEGCNIAKASSIVVDGGAKLRLVNGDTLRTDGLGGGGEVIAPKTELGEGGALLAVIGEDGQVPTLTVTGGLTLPANGKVRLVGDYSKLVNGSYQLLACAELTGDLAGWTVEAPNQRPHRVFTLRRTGNGVTLDMTYVGFVIEVR